MSTDKVSTTENFFNPSKALQTVCFRVQVNLICHYQTYPNQYFSLNFNLLHNSTRWTLLIVIFSWEQPLFWSPHPSNLTLQWLRSSRISVQKNKKILGYDALLFIWVIQQLCKRIVRFNSLWWNNKIRMDLYLVVIVWKSHISLNSNFVQVQILTANHKL